MLNKNIPSTIYHYCSLQTLHSIISKKSLWLTSLSSTNDSTELQECKKLLDLSIEEISKNYNDGSIEKKLLNNFKNSKPYKHFNYYGLSCIEEKDSLTHWEFYGDNSQGICIGLNLDYLFFLLEKTDNTDYYTDYLRGNSILYSDNDKINFMTEILSDFIEEYKNHPSTINDPIFLSNSIYNTILEFTTPLFKHHNFVNEKEYRLFFIENSKEEYIKALAITGKQKYIDAINSIFKDLNLSKENKQFHLFKNGIRGYYPLNLDWCWNDKLIPEIILGTKCTQNKNELKQFLKQHNLNKTKISISKILFR